MIVHLFDGTYELFRHFFAVPSLTDSHGHEVGAVRAVLRTLVVELEAGATHLGVATDHVIESFRNQLWPGYKTSEGIEPALLQQFRPLERAVALLGVTVWPMVEFEADDALASAALLAATDPRVEQVRICTPDKDLAQSVTGDRIVQHDRRTGVVRNEAGVVERFGVPPVAIPDYLALVGDAADGFPGVPGWGAKSAAAVVGRYGRLEHIPRDPSTWAVNVRGASRLASALAERWEDALLFRDLATLRTDVPVGGGVDEWEWRGPAPDFELVCAQLKDAWLLKRVQRLAERGAER